MNDDTTDAVRAEFGQIWMEVLGVDATDADDDFFDLGGHSLSALRLSMLIRQELNHAVQLQHVLENPRYADLVEITVQAPAERTTELNGGGRG